MVRLLPFQLAACTDKEWGSGERKGNAKQNPPRVGRQLAGRASTRSSHYSGVLLGILLHGSFTHRPAACVQMLSTRARSKAVVHPEVDSSAALRAKEEDALLELHDAEHSLLAEDAAAESDDNSNSSSSSSSSKNGEAKVASFIADRSSLAVKSNSTSSMLETSEDTDSACAKLCQGPCFQGLCLFYPSRTEKTAEEKAVEKKTAESGLLLLQGEKEAASAPLGGAQSENEEKTAKSPDAQEELRQVAEAAEARLDPKTKLLLLRKDVQGLEMENEALWKEMSNHEQADQQQSLLSQQREELRQKGISLLLREKALLLAVKKEEQERANQAEEEQKGREQRSSMITDGESGMKNQNSGESLQNSGAEAASDAPVRGIGFLLEPNMRVGFYLLVAVLVLGALVYVKFLHRPAAAA